MAEFELVRVTWNDAHGGSSEMFMVDQIPHEPAVMTTYGLLLKQDEKGVSVANEIHENGQVRGHTFIPAQLIINVQSIQTRRVRKKKAQIDSTQAQTPGAESPAQSSPQE